MYRLHNEYQSDKRSPQQIHKVIIVAWYIVCILFQNKRRYNGMPNTKWKYLNYTRLNSNCTILNGGRSTYFSRLNNNYGSGKRSPQPIHKSIAVVWCIVCIFLEQEKTQSHHYKFEILITISYLYR